MTVFEKVTLFFALVQLTTAFVVVYFGWQANSINRQNLFTTALPDVRAIAKEDTEIAIEFITALNDAFFPRANDPMRLRLIHYAVSLGLVLDKPVADIASSRSESLSTDNKKPWLIWVGGFAIVGAFAALLFFIVPQPSAQQQVNLAASRNLWSSVPIIAEKQGYFAEEELDVEIEYVQAARFAMDAVMSGQSQLGTVVDINLAYAGLNGNDDLRLISTIVKANDSAIIARTDKGITTAEQLVGKRLGVLGGTTSEIFADRYLEARGIDPSSVNRENLQPVAMQTALVNGGVDAASIWQPFIHNITNALGADNVVIFQDAEAYTGFMNIAATAGWLQENPETAAAFLRAMDKAKRFIDENPEQAQQILAEEIDLELPVVQAIWGQYEFRNQLAQEELLEVVVAEAEWIIAAQEENNGPMPAFERYLLPRTVSVSAEN